MKLSGEDLSLKRPLLLKKDFPLRLEPDVLLRVLVGPNIEDWFATVFRVLPDVFSYYFLSSTVVLRLGFAKLLVPICYSPDVGL